MFYKSNNNIFVSLKTVEQKLLSIIIPKDKIFNVKNNLKLNIRKKKPLNVNLVTLSQDKITNFSFFGGITRKKKPRSLNGGVTLSTILSGKRVNLTVGNNSNSVRFSNSR